MKMWEGRFSKELDESVNDFNSSIRFDKRLYREDITGSIAHAEMLGKCGVIGADDSKKIVEGLEGILSDLEGGALKIDETAEDIHMFVEQVLTQRIGQAGKMLHTARSRNDQVCLDMHLYVKKTIKSAMARLCDLLTAVYQAASHHKESVMPGYTHLQRAQPVTFAHYLLAYAQMFLRDAGRLEDAYKRADVMPLGSGALSTTTYPIDRQYVCDALGFAAVTDNSIDAVADRDFVIEFVFCLSVIMMHLSRFSEEIILWSSSEFSFIELDDAFSTGSSIMPQKKNPDVAELVRGKTARVYGDLTTLLAMMKSLPLAYNKDMQEDKEALFDAADNALKCLSVFTKMFDTLYVNTANMRRAAAKGFINATDCADYLVKKGVAFRDAYKITGGLIRYAIEHDKTLETLSLAEYMTFSGLFEKNIYAAIDLNACVENRRVYSGPGSASVEMQLKKLAAGIERAREFTE
jgi:argininosuccinate lyase